MTIRFMKHYVTNGALKARVGYSAFRMTTTGRLCVTLYAKSCRDGDVLAKIFPKRYENDTDIMTDYFERGRARILESDPLYDAALARAVQS